MWIEYAYSDWTTGFLKVFDYCDDILRAACRHVLQIQRFARPKPLVLVYPRQSIHNVKSALAREALGKRVANPSSVFAHTEIRHPQRRVGTIGN